MSSSSSSSVPWSSTTTSKPRPIHLLPRELNSVPDEKEPSFSYEQESFMGGREEDLEDAFLKTHAHHHHYHHTKSSGGVGGTGGGGGGSILYRSRDTSAPAVTTSSSSSTTSLLYQHHPPPPPPQNGHPPMSNNNNNNASTNISSSEAAATSVNGSFWRANQPGPPPQQHWDHSNSGHHKGGHEEPSFSSMNLQEHVPPLYDTATSSPPWSLGTAATPPAGRPRRTAAPSSGLGLALQSYSSTASGVSTDSSATSSHHNQFSPPTSPPLPATHTTTNTTTPATVYRNHEPPFRHDSSLSSGSVQQHQREAKKRDVSKQRAADRRWKLEAQSDEMIVGHGDDVLEDDHFDDDLGAGGGEEGEDVVILPPPNFQDMGPIAHLDRFTSDQSTGSLLYGKTPASNALLGKSSSLIFPTGVDASVDVESETDKEKQRRIHLALDQCETAGFAGFLSKKKPKLILSNMKLSARDIPLKDLCGTALGNTLHKLSLAGNRIGAVPPKLVQSLPLLKHLDLSQCELSQLPERWNLPKLSVLNLSLNRFADFPEECVLEGLPELRELNLYGNKVAAITLPSNPKLLSKLEILDLGYNELIELPPELDQIRSLRVLKVMNNYLTTVPMRVCEMDLKSIDVSMNQVTQPPLETCERGICSMRRYWHLIRMEEQASLTRQEEVQRKLERQKKKPSPKVKSYGFQLLEKFAPKSAGSKPSPAASRKYSDSDNASSVAASSIVSTVDASVRSVASPPVAIPSESDLRKSAPPRLGVEGVIQEKPQLHDQSLDERHYGYATTPAHVDENFKGLDRVTINDTLKVIFVGMAMVGKTSMIKRLIEGRDAIVPTHDERTVGVDIYEWDPKQDKRFEHIDSRIVVKDPDLARTCGDVDVKFSVWDFAGQHVYHATHELFFSSRALYVLVWDMGATNRATLKRKASTWDEKGAFKLSYDSSDDEEDEPTEDDTLAAEEECRRADRALERDIDEKVQFWVDCIQSSAPGAAILPVASFNDFFENQGGEAEAKRRCNMLKQRLLKHEERRKGGIKMRLEEYRQQNRANDLAARRLRKLLCSYTRPKLIFGNNEDDCVVRVSGTQYTGFGDLTKKIIDIATGKDKANFEYPLFQGHIGVRIPRMRLEVREAVRTMRDRFKVVEWGYFICQLRDKGLTEVEDICEALHFLTNTGELSYFGGVIESDGMAMEKMQGSGQDARMDDDDDEDRVDEGKAILPMDDGSITAPTTDDGSSLTSVDDYMSGGLSQFVFLNPRWLVAAVACILRHDLDREIKETRRVIAAGGDRHLVRTTSFYDAHLNCPVITAEDALLLWQAKRITKKAAERAQEKSVNLIITPFEFLQLLLIRFGVFVPIDLSIETALLGGKDYANVSGSTLESGNELVSNPGFISEVEFSSSEGASDKLPKFFFLPSLLGPCEPADAWSYKNTDSWKTTLCHAVLFPDGVPPGLMERLTATVLSSIYAVSNRNESVFCKDQFGRTVSTFEGKLRVKEILCWRTAFFLKIGTEVRTQDGSMKESLVEVFTHLADKESHLCVGSDYMAVGMRRLIISGRGQVGDGGKKIWKGGYLLVCKCISRVMEAYGGLEYEKHGFCPECLSKKPVSEASSWDFAALNAAVLQSESNLRCQHGHQIDSRLVTGYDVTEKSVAAVSGAPAPISVRDLLRAVVVVGLWDGKSGTIRRVGSGFVVDKKNGLIVTASHTLINIWGERNSPYGENYHGLSQGKVVIGVIPDEAENGKDEAVFRYFAKIVAKDPDLDRGECHLDACVLRITTRMENDVGGNGSGCGEQPEILLLNNPRAMKNERLQALKITEKCELDEEVRIIGYNQGGEGLLGPGERLNRIVDFARGYVCKKFTQGDDSDTPGSRRDRFKPRQEIVVICPTIGGHSGGPCVNLQGEVIGILSRADPTENQRCYIAPSNEWRALVKDARREAKNQY